MGYGDDIIATGLAKGLAAQGKLAAFGDRRKIVWGPWSEEMFRHNPNIARPEHTGKPNLQWIPTTRASGCTTPTIMGVGNGITISK